MAWNLASFRKNIPAVALNQYFEVSIDGIDGHNSERLTALARTTELPAMQHETLGVPYRALEMKIETKVTFTDWNVTFLCEQEHQLRTALLEIQAKMYKLDTASNEPHDVYKFDKMSVSKVGYNGEPVPGTECAFFGAFPSNIGAVSLDQAGGAFDTFDVTFTYDYFIPNYNLEGNTGRMDDWTGKPN
jgi:hypothetical protein